MVRSYSVALGLSLLATLGAAKRPNILFIMSDDHAVNAVSAYTDEHMETPNIDRIAKEGMRFDRAFVTNSLCGPARAVVLTSKYSHINGFKRNDNTKFNERQWTFPKALQAAGYYTGIVGKYHLNSEPDQGGFDFWSILPGQGQYYNPEFIEMGTTVKYMNSHVTDVITNLTLDVLKNKAPKDKPWMVMMQHKAPHRNHAAPPRYFGKFQDKEFNPPETFFDDYSTRSPASAAADNKIKNQYWSFDFKLDLGDRSDPGTGGSAPQTDGKSLMEQFLLTMTAEQRRQWDQFYGPLSQAFYANNYTGTGLEVEMFQMFMRDYTQSVAAVDDSVGEVLDFLQASGQLDETLVVYTSDQGFFLGEHGFFDKRFMYEPSLRTPLAMRWPGHIKPGSVSQSLALNLDYGATFCAVAGTTIPPEVQGESLLPVMLGSPGEAWRKSIYYHYYEFPGIHHVRKQYGVRTATHKLIKFYGDDLWASEMYDMVNDPNELLNLYGIPEYRHLQDSLHWELEALQAKYNDTHFPPDAESRAALPEELRAKIQYEMQHMGAFAEALDMDHIADDFAVA